MQNLESSNATELGGAPDLKETQSKKSLHPKQKGGNSSNRGGKKNI